MTTAISPRVIGLGEDPVTSFSSTYRFLSNPFPRPVWFEDVTYPSAEHAFQAAKTLDWDTRRRIAGTGLTWQEAKSAGRSLQLRPGWDKIRRAVMLQVLLAKFTQNDDLGDALAATGDRMLLEGNWWGDTYWGAVKRGHRQWSADLTWWQHWDGVWAGGNWLGVALMHARYMLAPECTET